MPLILKNIAIILENLGRHLIHSQHKKSSESKNCTIKHFNGRIIDVLKQVANEVNNFLVNVGHST